MNKRILIGICIFGPTAPPVPITIFGEIGKYKVRELTRLVINDHQDKNLLSFFVSRALKMLPEMCVVSFADAGHHHHGYIYQATNWIYTGEGGQKETYENNKGQEIHSLTLNEHVKQSGMSKTEYLNKHDIMKIKPKPKHRYLYFIGSKKTITEQIQRRDS